MNHYDSFLASLQTTGHAHVMSRGKVNPKRVALAAIHEESIRSGAALMDFATRICGSETRAAAQLGELSASEMAEAFVSLCGARDPRPGGSVTLESYKVLRAACSEYMFDQGMRLIDQAEDALRKGMALVGRSRN